MNKRKTRFSGRPYKVRIVFFFSFPCPGDRFYYLNGGSNRDSLKVLNPGCSPHGRKRLSLFPARPLSRDGRGASSGLSSPGEPRDLGKKGSGQASGVGDWLWPLFARGTRDLAIVILHPGCSAHLEKKHEREKRTAKAALPSLSNEDVFPLWEKPKVLRSRAKSQWIAVWWLLYQVQHPGRYLSRLQTDWLTHDIASVSKVRQRDPSMTMNGHESGGVH